MGIRIKQLEFNIKHRFYLLFVALFLILYALFSTPHVLAVGPKRVEINLTTQHLYAYEGNTLIYNFLISSGKWYPTVTGIFYPYWKTPSIRMVGGSKALGTYYDLPNVPWDVFFYQGYAIHGTYWHSNFGHPMSHGCVNMSIYNAHLLYNWIDYSTPIIIYGITPAS